MKSVITLSVCQKLFSVRTCANYGGIADATGTVCCHAKCGECGGKNCGARCCGENGPSKCCSGEIKDKGKICGYETEKAPCYQKTVGNCFVIYTHFVEYSREIFLHCAFFALFARFSNKPFKFFPILN